MFGSDIFVSGNANTSASKLCSVSMFPQPVSFVVMDSCVTFHATYYFNSIEQGIGIESILYTNQSACLCAPGIIRKKKMAEGGQQGVDGEKEEVEEEDGPEDCEESLLAQEEIEVVIDAMTEQ